MGRVGLGIAAALAQENEVHVLGAETEPPPGTWRAHPHDARHDPLKRDAAEALAEELNPDCAVLVGVADPEMGAAIKRRRPLCEVLIYLPVDGPLPAVEAVAAAAADLVVAPTREGERHLVEAGVSPERIRHIPHSLDPAVFHPLGSAREAKASCHPDRPEAWDAPWVLNANRNLPRKRLDLTLRAFAEALSGGRDAWLVLHTGRPTRGVHLEVWAARLQVEHRVLFSRAEIGENGHPSWPDSSLNQLYNACEIGINTSEREGWGLVPYEHAATGAPQIVADTSILREIWGEAALYFDGDKAGAALGSLLADSVLRRRRGDAARARATRSETRDDTVANSWRRLLAEVVPCAS
jgi:D-inositol-3-phosphate glycosyltransferase